MVAAAAALVAAIATPLTTWIISRTSRKDKRQNITRDLDILKQLNPESETHKLLETRVSQDIQQVVAQADIRDELGPVWRKYFTIIGLITLASGLGWANRQEWLPEYSNTSIAIVRVACWTAAVVLALQLSAKLVKVFWLAAPIGRIQASIHILQLKVGYAKLRGWLLKRRKKSLIKRRAREVKKMTKFIENDLTERFRRGATLESVLKKVDAVPAGSLDGEEVERIRLEIMAAHERVAAEGDSKNGSHPED